jgi:hypothetical protein
MHYALDELDYQRPEPYKLKRHIGINSEYLNSLSSLDITTSRELIEAGKTKFDREHLSEKTGIRYEHLEELVKLSDLSRKWGPIRTRLYYDAGYDTFEKIGVMDPKEFRASIKEYIRTAGVEYHHPTPREAISAVAGAKRRPKIVME